ncbi:integrase arm-type DNA-binding domain-containing protein [Sphingomonas sp. MG17]|uniref:Integrase arm-type DNA-binding domain-containing protein n=1 Tax=Sphingomonas tagetis TaxID=2949092 RepID=A0A9X2KJZ1_9SPHN|nr:integrase arm-type DNA-binding domain-containing protein [Sphingomonas tagetis]MCP3729235.1 integrase arm-type DNA-binding domain-containing protein [Sphingomonas tagetis]
MLTNAAVKAAAPRSAAYKMADGRGLHLLVAPTGRKSWRMKCRIAGREQLLTFGRYPEMSLVCARARVDQVREQLRRGEDPRGTAAPAEQLHTLEQLARAWHAGRLERWSAEHAGDVIESLENHVFPSIGAKHPDDVDEAQILELLGRLEATGKIETARRVRQRLEAIFKYARRRRLASIDPTDVVDELAVRPPAQPMPALVTAAECRELLAGIDATASPIVARAARFVALTAVRVGSLRAMRWREVEGLDGNAPIWRIPPAHLKLAKAKKAEARFEHIVPLAPAAAELLRAAAAENGYDTRSAPADALVFPIGEAAIGDAIARAGFKGRHVPHGWRASFSTILNEALPNERDAIDAALAHANKNKVEGAYNRAEQLARRRRLFEIWADLILS